MCEVLEGGERVLCQYLVTGVLLPHFHQGRGDLTRGRVGAAGEQHSTRHLKGI